jgi:hypothetical protein
MALKISTRCWFGGTLIGISVIAGFLLFFSGSPPVSVEHSDGHAGPNGFSWSGAISFNWPFFVLLTVGVMGLVILVIPRRKLPNDKF